MRNLAMILVLSAIGTPSAYGSERAPQPFPMTPKPIQVAVVCNLTGQQVSGMNRICMYNCLGSAAAITVGAAELCPLSINR